MFQYIFHKNFLDFRSQIFLIIALLVFVVVVVVVVVVGIEGMSFVMQFTELVRMQCLTFRDVQIERLWCVALPRKRR